MKSQTSTISDYQLRSTLGQGMFGKVKLGLHKATSHPVAIKVMYKHRISESSQVQRISRQIAILKAVSHRSVVRLYEIIETREEIYMIMEFAERGDLMGYIKGKESLGEEEAAGLFSQVLDAVEYIHTMGIAHRDLKPTNILLTKDMKIKLADFGLSNTYKLGSRLTTSCGSPCYAAPQVIQARPYQPLPADLWSLGIILYLMLCGFLPFQHKSTHSLYKLILGAHYSIPRSVSRLASDLITHLLKVNPSKRLHINEIRSHPWLRLHCGRGTEEEIIKEVMVTRESLDRNVIELIHRMGYDQESLVGQLLKKKHSKLTTMYGLFCEKKQEEILELLEKYKEVKEVKEVKSNSTFRKSDMKSPELEPCYSTKKLLRRTTTRGNQQVLRRSSGSKDDKGLNFKGGYLKMLNNNNVSATNTNPTANTPQINITATATPTNHSLNTSTNPLLNNPTPPILNTLHPFLPGNLQLPPSCLLPNPSPSPSPSPRHGHGPSQPRLTRKTQNPHDKRSLDFTTNTSNPSSSAQRQRKNSVQRNVSLQNRKKGRMTSFIKRMSNQQGIDVYDGPFNLEAVFAMPPAELRLKMLSFLRVQKVAYKEVDRWVVEVALEGEQLLKVAVNKIMDGLFMVKFAGCELQQPPICRKILSFLRD